MSLERVYGVQSPKWKNSAYAGTRLIRTGTTLSNLVLKVFLSQLRTDYCSASPKLIGSAPGYLGHRGTLRDKRRVDFSRAVGSLIKGGYPMLQKGVSTNVWSVCHEN